MVVISGVVGGMAVMVTRLGVLGFPQRRMVKCSLFFCLCFVSGVPKSSLPLSRSNAPKYHSQCPRFRVPGGSGSFWRRRR